MKTKVVFRQYKIGCEVIALFPEIPGDITGFFCVSYMRCGQHGAATPYLINDTKPANLEDGAVKRLIVELTELGYDLEIIKRFRYTHYLIRRESVKGVK